MGNPAPYYKDDTVTLYHGDMREVLPQFNLQQQFACVVTDPPYAETSLRWDRWPDGWPAVIAPHAASMWCFGSLRMFLDRRDEFAGWKLSSESVGEFEVDTIAWEKHNGTGFATDRPRKVHELIAHWYRGRWSDVYHDVPREPVAFKRGGGTVASTARVTHTGAIGDHNWTDSGTRQMRSVVRAPSVRRGLHSTQKPVPILVPLIEYACPAGGTVLDPFAGSGSTAEAARLTGRRAVLVEGDETYCEAIAARLSQGVLELPGGDTRA